MSNIIELGKVRKAKEDAKKDMPITMKDVDMELERNISDLSRVTGKTREEAIKMASDFYRKYPMLIEYVRSPEYMMGREW